MRRYVPGMNVAEILFWVIECMPGAALISVFLTLAASILFDYSLESASWSGLFLRFLPGFIFGLLIMLAISNLLHAMLRGVLRLFGRDGG
jgi:hypothetical protein